MSALRDLAIGIWWRASLSEVVFLQDVGFADLDAGDGAVHPLRVASASDRDRWRHGTGHGQPQHALSGSLFLSVARSTLRAFRQHDRSLPVGALTSKPFVSSARSWELSRRPVNQSARHRRQPDRPESRTTWSCACCRARQRKRVNRCWISDRIAATGAEFTRHGQADGRVDGALRGLSGTLLSITSRMRSGYRRQWVPLR